MWDVVQSERRKVDRLTRLVGRLSETVGVPLGSLDDSPPTSSSTSPNPSIYVSGPVAPWDHQHQMPERKRPRIDTAGLSMNSSSAASSGGGGNSPIPHISSAHSHSPLHHHSQQHLSSHPSSHSPLTHQLPQLAHPHSTLSSPLDSVPPSKKYARARSDSAPLHHHQGGGHGQQHQYAYQPYWGSIERPRSGTGMRANGGGVPLGSSGMGSGMGGMGNGMGGGMGMSGMVNISGQGQGQ